MSELPTMPVTGSVNTISQARPHDYLVKP